MFMTPFYVILGESITDIWEHRFKIIFTTFIEISALIMGKNQLPYSAV